MIKYDTEIAKPLELSASCHQNGLHLSWLSKHPRMWRRHAESRHVLSSPHSGHLYTTPMCTFRKCRPMLSMVISPLSLPFPFVERDSSGTQAFPSIGHGQRPLHFVVSLVQPGVRQSASWCPNLKCPRQTESLTGRRAVQPGMGQGRRAPGGG